MRNAKEIKVILRAHDRFTELLRDLGRSAGAASYALAVIARRIGKGALVYALAEGATRHYMQAGPWAEILDARRNKINWI